mmetsp:Transcript_97954/g.263196  ORF Transcript_97954/g.263196 Transcript_97954/m.263196 type:complete len:311 (-) Transcript_97954:2-934(-)
MREAIVLPVDRHHARQPFRAAQRLSGHRGHWQVRGGARVEVHEQGDQVGGAQVQVIAAVGPPHVGRQLREPPADHEPAEGVARGADELLVDPEAGAALQEQGCQLGVPAHDRGPRESAQGPQEGHHGLPAEGEAPLQRGRAHEPELQRATCRALGVHRRPHLVQEAVEQLLRAYRGLPLELVAQPRGRDPQAAHVSPGEVAADLRPARIQHTRQLHVRVHSAVLVRIVVCPPYDDVFHGFLRALVSHQRSEGFSLPETQRHPAPDPLQRRDFRKAQAKQAPDEQKPRHRQVEDLEGTLHLLFIELIGVEV